MIRSIFALALVALPITAIAQTNDGATPKRIRSVQITSTQKCPVSTTPDEVVVCTTVDNPYRIPKELRDSAPIPTARQSWVNRVAADENSARSAAGLPDTCSTVGTGGQTGCARAAAQAYAADKRARANGRDPNASNGD